MPDAENSNGQANPDQVCPICGSERYTPLFQVPFPGHSAFPGRAFPLSKTLDVPAWRFVRCRDCSVRYPNPRPSPKDIASYYAEQAEPIPWEVEHYVEIPQKARRAYESFAEKLTELKGSPGSLLEIGCAAGWLLYGARKVGWGVAGIEASPKFQRYASSVLKLPVMLGALENIEPAQIKSKSDVLVMMDVIEHLYDPVAALEKLRGMIAENGYLILTTCNIESFCAKIYGHHWRQIVISHVFYWTKNSLALALRRAGFKVEHYSEPRYWHPNRGLECLGCLREAIKLILRGILSATYGPLTKRFTGLQRVIGLVTGGKLDHAALMYKIGDQPVLNDVMLVIARPV